jgi:hypothetical protein
MEAAMFGDALGWIFGALLLLFLIVYVLDYLGLVDVIEAIVVIFRLALGVIGMIAALLLWLARKMSRRRSRRVPPVCRKTRLRRTALRSGAAGSKPGPWPVSADKDDRRDLRLRRPADVKPVVSAFCRARR